MDYDMHKGHHAHDLLQIDDAQEHNHQNLLILKLFFTQHPTLYG